MWIITGIISITGILAVFTLGLGLVQLLYPATRWMEKLSLGYLLGLGSFTFVLFLLNTQGLAYTFANASLVIILMNAVVWGLLRSQILSLKISKTALLKFAGDQKAKLKLLRPWEWGILITLGFIVGSSLVNGLYWPVRDWDSVVLYDFRAKTFMATGYMDDGIARGYFFGYPLLVTLGHMWAYFLGFGSPTFLHGLLYTSFVVTFYALVRRYLSRANSLILTLLLASSVNLIGHSIMTYTNLAYLIYYCLGCFYLSWWTKEKRFGTLLLSAVLIGFSTWTRSYDPFWLATVIVATLYSVGHFHLISTILFPSVVHLIRRQWIHFEEVNLNQARSLTNNLPEYTSVFASYFELQRFIDVTLYIWTYVIWPNFYHFLAMMFSLGLVVLLTKKITREMWIILGILIMNLGIVFAGTFVFSVGEMKWDQIGDSARRMTMFFQPLALYFVALCLPHFIKSPNKQHA